MESSSEAQPSLELESINALTKLTDADKRKVLEYIESLILLEQAHNGPRDPQ